MAGLDNHDLHALLYMAADRLLDKILAALDQASQLPFSGDEVFVGGKTRSRMYRRLYVHPYHIYCRILDDEGSA